MQLYFLLILMSVFYTTPVHSDLRLMCSPSTMEAHFMKL